MQSVISLTAPVEATICFALPAYLRLSQQLTDNDAVTRNSGETSMILVAMSGCVECRTLSLL